MTNYDYDLLVVGAGPGGQSAAIAASRLGKRVGIIERKPYLGGVSLQTGTIPSKALREAAYVTSRFAARGMRGPLERRPKNDQAFLRDALVQKNRIIDSKEAVILKRLLEVGVTIIPGEASFVDAHQLGISSTDAKTKFVSAEYIVLATGSRPRRPATVPFDRNKILDSTSILKLQRLPQSLLVIGGGVIACEFATMFAPLGVDVAIVDSHKHLLAYLDKDIAAILETEMRNANIKLHMSTQTDQITVNNSNGLVQVHTTSGELLEADKLLYALGREPNYTGLLLEKAGLIADDQGWVSINANHQTAQQHIYIIGDLAGRPSLAATAIEQGRLATYHAFDREHAQSSGPLPMAIYTIPELSYVGETERELKARGADYVTGTAKLSETARGQIIGEEGGVLKLLAERNNRQILGVHIIGESASELVHVGQMAMACSASVDLLAGNVFNYPTLAQSYKTAAIKCIEGLGA